MILRSELVIVVIALFVPKLNAQHPTVPCPGIFQYSRAGDKYIGLITLNDVKTREIGVEIDLSQSGTIDSADWEHAGNITLNSDEDKIIDSIKSGQPYKLEYKIDFGIQNVIPQVSAIRLNGFQICFGSDYDAPSVKFILKHSLTAPDPSNINTRQDQKALTTISSSHIVAENIPGINFFDNPTFLSSNKVTYSFSNHPLDNEFDKEFDSAFDFDIPSKRTNKPATYSTTTRIPRARARPTLPLPSQSLSSSQLTPRPSTQWTDIESVCGRENFNLNKLAFKAENVRRARFPWIVALFKKAPVSLSFLCGGNLITTRTVISAAHCFYNGFDRIKDEDILVSLGRHNLTDWTDSYITHRDVERIIEHPDYKTENDKTDADIAIMQLKTSVTFSSAIRPVCLWRGLLSANYIEGLTGTVVGWGRDEKNDVATSPKLVTAKIPSQLDCVRSNDKLYYLTSNRTLCAGNLDGSGPCTGDSGSGLMIKYTNKWMLRGTVSFALASSSHECDLEQYVVYTDVAQFLEWIYANSVF